MVEEAAMKLRKARLGRRPAALWVSTSLDTRGGVASYVRTLGRSPLAETWSVRHLVTHRDGSVLGKIAVFARAAVEFGVILVIDRPDVVHLHMSSYGSFVRKAILAACARLFRIPVVLHVHGSEFHMFFEHSPRALQAWMRWTLNGAAAVLALGDRWADRLRRIAPGAAVVVVPNAIALVGPAEEPAEGQPVHVVFLGEIGDRKGTFTLLEAWAKVTVNADGWARLTVAGDGEVERAEQRIAELELASSVDLRRWLGPAEVAELLRSAQLLCLPSRDEGQPMAVLEAMANGLCVVATDVGGIPELLAEDSGVLLSPDDVDALAAALRRLIENPAERARIGARALDRVRTTFDIDVVWRRIDAVYREAIAL
jgi:glycosyltransferase involved in cell wall biosynthesis